MFVHSIWPSLCAYNEVRVRRALDGALARAIGKEAAAAEGGGCNNNSSGSSGGGRRSRSDIDSAIAEGSGQGNGHRSSNIRDAGEDAAAVTSESKPASSASAASMVIDRLWCDEFRMGDVPPEVRVDGGLP